MMKVDNPVEAALVSTAASATCEIAGKKSSSSAKANARNTNKARNVRKQDKVKALIAKAAQRKNK